MEKLVIPITVCKDEDMESGIQNDANLQSNYSTPINDLTKPPQKSPFLLFGIIVVVCLIVGSIGFYLLQQNSIRDSLEKKVTPNITSRQIQPTEVDVNNTLQTYTNTILGYSFQYPSNLIKVFQNNDYIVPFIPVESDGNDDYPFGLKVTAYNSLNGVSVDDFRYLTIETYINTLQKQNYWQIQSKKPVQLGGISGYRLNTETISSETGQISYYAIRTLVKKEDYVYEITLHIRNKEDLFEKEKIYDQILTTFNFILFTPTAQKEDESLSTYCCSITYNCPDKSIKHLFVKNHSVHRFNKPINCKVIGTGIPDPQVYDDEKCTLTLDPYVDYCQRN